MDFLSLKEIKNELSFLEKKELVDIVLELTKFNKDNKDLVGIRLASKDDPLIFLKTVKEELDSLFAGANTNNYFVAKKSLQNIRRRLNLKLRLTKDKEQQLDLLIYFCERTKEFGFLGFRHPVIDNIYQMQFKKAKRVLDVLHEDIRYDYESKIQELIP